VRFPNDITTLRNLHQGHRVDVEVDADGLTIRRTHPIDNIADPFAGKPAAE
jgi:hypothetical protein